MADEFNSTGSWWDSTRPTNTRFDPAAAGSSSSSSALGGFGWTTEMVSDVKPRTSIESVSVSGSSVHDSSTDLHMMGLCLSSQPMDWNQTLLSRGDNKSESGFRSMLQESLSSSSSYATQESAWRAEESVASVRGFSLDQSAESPVTASSFHMDSAALYGNPSTYLQGILGPDNHPSSAPNRGLSFHQFGGSSNYGSVNPNEIMQLQQPAASSWNNNNNNNTSSSKVPQFLRSSPPKQLLFSNNAPFWNPAAAVSDVRPSFFSSSLQPQFPTSAPNFDEKPKNISEVGDSTSSVGKKSGSEALSKRPRNETTSTLPAFKVRKEKMGDRITALQQLVSPFGKTDTASVLSEAIEYIKFLHEQVNVLSTPYMKSGASTQHQQQNSDKSNEAEGPKQDLRSRGLCLVPVSSTFPVTHETTVDFWTPTFGGTFR